MRRQFKLLFITFALFTAMISIATAQSSSEAAKQRLLLQARLVLEGPILKEGVEWRIFGSVPNEDGDLPELIVAEGGSSAFDIARGEYIIHASFGHAAAVKKIRIGDEAVAEEFVFNAGGFRLKATTTGNAPIPNRMLRFDIYEQGVDEDTGERKLLARNLKADEIIAFPTGTYHVVSRYGDLNATVRADLRVHPGKLTEASLQHRAALLSFRLVRQEGGDAVADTAWSILTENGEVIRESNSTFPSMVLSEGNYTAIAKHNEAVYSQDFLVRPGFNKEVEVLAPN